MDVVNVEDLVKNSNKREIEAIIQTMEQIEVHGSQNLNMLLGCIQHLTALKNKLGEEDK